MGCSPPRSATAASNQSVDPSELPPQVILTAPTGTTPRETSVSWSVQPIVAMRVGSVSITASPSAWVTVTGNASAAGAEDPAGEAAPDEVLSGLEVAAGPVEQALSASTATTAPAMRDVRGISGFP